MPSLFGGAFGGPPFGGSVPWSLCTTPAIAVTRRTDYDISRRFSRATPRFFQYPQPSKRGWSIKLTSKSKRHVLTPVSARFSFRVLPSTNPLFFLSLARWKPCRSKLGYESRRSSMRRISLALGRRIAIGARSRKRALFGRTCGFPKGPFHASMFTPWGLAWPLSGSSFCCSSASVFVLATDAECSF